MEEDGVKLAVSDIWLLGSNANYNYTDESDLDIHIIANQSFDCRNKHLPIIYNAYKTLFNRKYDITINGINVEIYVENKDQVSATSSGIYSVKKDKWITEPSKFDIPEIDEAELQREINTWENRYQEVYGKHDLDSITKYIDDIYDMRKKSIMREGEFGIGNLVFKEIRRCGYLDELKELKSKLESKKLSLEEDMDSDIDKFIDKFGEEVYQDFVALEAKLISKRIPTKLSYHVKYTDPEDLKILLQDIQQSTKEDSIITDTLPGDYEHLGYGKGYDVYKINDYKAAMSLGANTLWGVAGRTPREEDLNSYFSISTFNDYRRKDISVFYFIGKDDNTKRYAMLYYPPTITEAAEEFNADETKYLYSNFELFNQNDEWVREELETVPYQYVEDYVGYKLYTKIFPVINNLVIDRAGYLLKVGDIEYYVRLPETVKYICPRAFDNKVVIRVDIPDSVKIIYEEAFIDCGMLETVVIGNGVTEMYPGIFDQSCKDQVYVYTDNEIVKKYCSKNNIKCKNKNEIDQGE